MKYFKTIAVVLILLLSIWATVSFGASQGTSSTTASSMIDDVRSLLNDTDATDEFWTDGELLQWLNDGMVDIVTRSHCLEAIENIFLDANTIEYSVTSTYLAIKTVQYVDADHKSWSLRKGSPANVGQDTTATIPEYWYDWAGKVGVYPALTSLANSSDTIAISGAADNGSGLVRITSAVHGFSTGDTVTVAGVVGTTEANADWTITVITTTTFDLVGSTYANTYTSGGTVFETETINLYYVTRPTAIASTATITTPAVYDRALMFYMMAQAKLKDRKSGSFEHLMQRYNQELDRYRTDFNDFPQVAE